MQSLSNGNTWTMAQLRKAAKSEASDLPSYRLAILADSASQHLAIALRGHARLTGLDLQVFDADYNQIDAQVLDANSSLYAFKPDAVLIWQCSERMLGLFQESSLSERSKFAKTQMEHTRRYWRTIESQCSAAILQFNFVRIDDACFGNYGLRTDDSFVYQMQELNYLLSREAHEDSSVFPIDLDAIQARLGRNRTYDEKFYYLAKMALSMEALPIAAKRVCDSIHALRGSVKKCVITDLDNTLWGGVIGDDGMEGIELGELGSGPAFGELQRYLKSLKERGVLIAICSKNTESIAKEPFEKHPDMVLQLDDVAVFVANWKDKASNIKYIQKTLNLGMDSFVFLDDNPFERDLVQSLIPELTVPKMPEDPALYVSYLRSLNLFETTSHSATDTNRTRQYQEEASRATLRESFDSYDDYLKGLNMVAEGRPFDAFHIPRIAQLTQRSNQFNLRTVRLTEQQVRDIAADSKHITRYYTLKDRFGDYGLISVVIMDKLESGELFISEWLMSCRVLKRGVEEHIINDLVGIAGSQGYSRLSGEYLPTKKNSMVEKVYSQLGFCDEGGGRFSLDVSHFVPNNTSVNGVERIEDE